MLEITQVNDKNGKDQSYECGIELNSAYTYWFWYWKDTKESVDDFKNWTIEWKRKLDVAFENIDYEELYKFDWERDRTLDFE